jgi:MoaA/NifB/PqqE/SkfB family radical SAM enzyme
MCHCKSCLWRHNDWEHVPTDTLKRFLSEARELGFVGMAISGGEPFMRRDLGEIVRFSKEELGFAQLVFTTGWYLPKHMDEVLPYLDAMVCSVDSAQAARHDAIRGLPGLFDRLMGVIPKVKARYPDLAVHFNTCIQRGVVDEIDDLVALSERMGVPISFDVITEARNGAAGAFTETEMGLPLAELKVAAARLAELKRAGKDIVNSARYFDYFAAGRPGYRCHFPKLVMSVDGRGNVEDCLDLDTPIGNICDTPLAEIVASARFKELRQDAEACSSCSSPTMVDLSQVWEDPSLLVRQGGLAFG